MHCIQHDSVVDYKSSLALDIYACMELSQQSYTDVVSMPYHRFLEYLKWKSDLEDEKTKKFEEQAS